MTAAPGAPNRGADPAAPLDPDRYSTLRRLVTDERHRVVVAFGGGSVPGICGNAALARILEELDLRPHVEEVWGTSAGAVLGGGWASGAGALDVLVLALTRGLDRRGAVDFHMLRFALAILASLWPIRRPMPDGLVHGRRIRETIGRGLRAETFEECPTPFRCIAVTDDGAPRLKVFRSGPLLPAIFASMSLPGVVVPQPVGPERQRFYDGGLLEKTPLQSPIAEHLRSGDRRDLLLIGTHFGPRPAGPARGFHNRFLASFDALENALWEHQLHQARARPGTRLLLLDPALQNPGMFDFDRCDDHYLRARQRFAEALQNARLVSTFGTV